MAVSTIDALYNGTSEKLTTSATGIDVTGTVTSDGLTVDGSSTVDDILFTAVALPGSGNPSIALRNSDNNIYVQTGSGNTLNLLDSSQNTMYSVSPTLQAFSISNSEKMRINSSGEILIGKTSAASSTVGAQIIAGGISQFGRSGAEALRLTRTTNNGNILEFQKNDTLVGSIGTINGRFYMVSTAMGVYYASTYIAPVNSSGVLTDNQYEIGNPSYRWEDAFITNGVTTGSDRTEKQDIATLTATEMLVAARLSQTFRTYRWKDKVVEKGDNARTHTGTIAQEVQVAFTAEGLDAGDYAMFMSDTWWEHNVDVPAVEAVAEVTDKDGNVTTEAVEAKDAYTRTDKYDTEAEAPEGATSKTRMGIRYPELLSFVAAYNEQRFASIEARLTALEA